MPLSTAIIDPNTGDITVPAHQLRAALLLHAHEKGTRGQALAGAARGRPFPAHAEADFDAVANVAKGKASPMRALFIEQVWAAAVQLQDGVITPAEFDALCEIR